ncbi:hypothetical protein evm_007279 [Chilo suppressalis]|nr:hypothetical protein evm_007279 [Chilo suppressalis]
MFYAEESIACPYVSPIKYATDVSDNDDSTTSYKSKKRKILHINKKNQNKAKQMQLHSPCRRTKQTHHSDEYWRKLSKYTFGYKTNKRYRASEPCPSIEKLSSYYTQTSGKPSSSFLSPSYSKQNSISVCPCSCHGKIANPMLKIGQYIDRLLKDVDDCQRL